MATFRKRKHLDGTVVYQAVIRIRRKGQIVHRESRVFWKYHAALSWARRREGELEDSRMLARAQAESKTIAELIRWYIDQFHSLTQWQRTKQSTLEFLERQKIGREDAYHLSASRLVQHVRSRRAGAAGPATAGVDLTYISVVLQVAQNVGSYPVDPQVVTEARNACRRLNLIGNPNRREVRPTEAQLLALNNYFLNRSSRALIPMADIMWFAVYSGRRGNEICHLRWADNDPRTRTGLVRDLKHPVHRRGNHRRFRYTSEA